MTVAAPTSTQPERQSHRFLALYAMAAAGGSASYAPFLTVILPHRIAEFPGHSSVQLLSYVAFFGAIAASASNLFFGWLSDRTSNRKAWIVVGTLLSGAILVSMHIADTVQQLLGMIIVWQIALNMMLNPLAAWAGDCVPDHQKGTLGGLLSLAPAVGALSGALVTIPGLAGIEARPVLIAFLVCALVLPVVFFGRPRPMPHLTINQAPALPSRPTATGDQPRQRAVPVWRMWLARLVIQVAEASLFAFLFLWLREIDVSVTDNDVASIFTVVLFCSVPVAIMAGRWSDRANRPMYPLVITALFSAMGLVTMAGSQSLSTAIAGYCIFGIAAAAFLALHGSQTLRVLPRPGNRGRDLGIFNLTNTIPSLIMPGLTLTLIPRFGFGILFLILAMLGAAAALLLATRRLR